jgi:hypothetical protein
MPGQVPPPPESYEVRSEEIEVRPADCGLNSHDTPSLQHLIDTLRERDEKGWEALSVHRSVWVSDQPQYDARGGATYGRRVRHEFALRVCPPRKHFEYKVDAVSDAVDPRTEIVLSARIREGWELIGCSTYDFRASTFGADGAPVEHFTKDAVMVWKRQTRKLR